MGECLRLGKLLVDFPSVLIVQRYGGLTKGNAVGMGDILYRMCGICGWEIPYASSLIKMSRSESASGQGA